MMRVMKRMVTKSNAFIFLLKSVWSAIPPPRRGVRRGSRQRVAGDHFLVERGAELGRALLRRVVDMDQAEARGVAVGPFEIVQQAPQEIAAHGNPLRRRALELRQVVAQVHYAIDVVDEAVGRRLVGSGGAVLGDVEVLDV